MATNNTPTVDSHGVEIAKYTPWIHSTPVEAITEFVLVEVKHGTGSNGGCCWATFDPKWGKTGAWFNRRGTVVGGVTGYRHDGHAYQLCVKHTFG